MALSGTTIRLLSFFLIFSIIFPTASFALSVGVTGQTDYGELDPEVLLQAGITLTDAETENISQNDAWHYITLNASQWRVAWKITGQWFEFSTKYLGFRWVEVPPVHYLQTWVIGNFSTDYNWTHLTIDPGGESQAHAFFTVHPDYDNITHSIQNGNVTLTIGRDFTQNPSDFWGFTSWFLGIITGVNTYNLPSIFVWLIQAIVAIGIVSAILLIKEFIPFLP